ncbi:MAG: histidine phosphatase family protein [Anaerolineae bacterium]|nr:histidine phosphatase family protein [Anaerolineae bacterium]
MTLWLVRHGETDWNNAGRIQGHTDIPLNENGRKQARKAAQRLAEQRFDAAYASDLSRARETAEIIAAAHGLPVQTDPRLRERSHGSLEGYFYQDIRLKHPDLIEALRADPVCTSMPGGESVADTAARMAAAADDLAARHPGGVLLVATHGLSLATLYCLANDLPLSRVREYIPENTAVIVIHWG